MQSISDFFREIDAAWSPLSATKIRLHIIGSAALMLQTSYARGTKDSDIIETHELDNAIQGKLLALAGSGTALARRRRMYLDIVGNGIPFLPKQPCWRPVHGLSGRLRYFEPEVLDVVDVVVAKLKRFNANDRDDVGEMVDRQLVPHHHLLDRFRDAVDSVSGDSFSERLPTIVANLNEIERDLYGVPETRIDLPGCR